MNDLVATLQNSPAEVREAEESMETAKLNSEQAYAYCFLKARAEASSDGLAKELAKLDPIYDGFKAEEIIAQSRYKEANNRMVNARKISELTRATL